MVDIKTFDRIARGLISKLRLNASEFPFFVFYNSVLSMGDSANLNNCCVLGYHNSESGQVTNPGQTYGVSDFEGRDNTLFTQTLQVDAFVYAASRNFICLQASC